jgi:hypothetical protein
VQLSQELVPWDFVHGGYGIPLPLEMPTDDALQSTLGEEKSIMLELEKEAPPEVVAARTESAQVSQNLHYFVVEVLNTNPKGK